MRRFPLGLLAAVLVVVPATAFGQAGQTPGPGQTPGQTPRPGQTPGAGAGVGRTPGLNPGGELVDERPALPKLFLSRVYSFAADADGYAGGELAITIHRIDGLSKAIRGAVNEAVDEQDGLALCGKFCRVVNRKGKRLKPKALNHADRVVIKGKMLASSAWHQDEDGNPVPTVRAKRIVVVR
jgi:hypothetical protein